MNRLFIYGLLPVIFLLSAIGFEARAQLAVGIHGGVNVSNYSGKYNNSTYTSKTGIVLGLVLQKQQNHWLTFQFELNYDMWGAKYNSVIDDGVTYRTEYADIVQDANYLDIPVLAKFDIGQKNRIFGYGGLYFGYLLSAEINGTQTVTNKYDPDDVTTTPVSRDYKDDISSFDMGAVLGLGADIRISDAISLFIDGRYNWGWVNTASQGDGKLRNSVWSFNLGLMYHLPKKE